jgi:hypothetical protein
MQFYKQWTKDPGTDFFKDDIYHFFYDQAHFIKDFKRFTYLSPLKSFGRKTSLAGCSGKAETSDFYNF